MSKRKILEAYKNGEFDMFNERPRARCMSVLYKISQIAPFFAPAYEDVTMIVFNLDKRPPGNKGKDNKYTDPFVKRVVHTWIKSSKFRDQFYERHGVELYDNGKEKTVRATVDHNDAHENLRRRENELIISRNVLVAKRHARTDYSKVDPNLLTSQDLIEKEKLPSLFEAFKPLKESREAYIRSLLEDNKPDSNEGSSDPSSES